MTYAHPYKPNTNCVILQTCCTVVVYISKACACWLYSLPRREGGHTHTVLYPLA
jgi:hypothetical protein